MTCNLANTKLMKSPHHFSEFLHSGVVIAAEALLLKVLLEESSHSVSLLLAFPPLSLTYTCLFFCTLAVRLWDLHVCGHQLYRRNILERLLGSQRYTVNFCALQIK